MRDPDNQALADLRKLLPELVRDLSLSNTQIESWIHVMDGKLLPRLSPEFPLMTAICGGGSSGKSTLFNSIVGDRLSPAGGKAGINRRILVSAAGELFRNREFLSTLFEPLGSTARPLEKQEELREPGCPLYVLSSNVPRNMVLMDTPDFDTGAGDDYANRDVVGRALETSDLLIYIFTNSNYNNKDNTDFISRMLTGIGMRRCFLVYRVYSGFPDEKVVDHAMVVARNIYKEAAEKYVLGIYRTDEDNAVAAQEAFMSLRPARPEDPPFAEALKNLVPTRLRPELIASIRKDTVKTARTVLENSRGAAAGLKLYLDALKSAQNEAIQEALRHFPMDIVLKRFSQIWMSTDPRHIRTMRKTGDIIGLPVKVLVGGTRKISRLFSEKKESSSLFQDAVEEDLFNAVHRIRTRSLQNRIVVSVAEGPITTRMLNAVDGFRYFRDFPDPPDVEQATRKGVYTFHVSVPPALIPEQERLRKKDWPAVLGMVLKQKASLIRLTKDVDEDLKALVADFRGRMGFSDKIRQTFSAFLNILPATVAMTYILSTGDPIGGAGIKIKLTGLFGLNDLYALIAIPATSRLSRKDREQIEQMLQPIIQSWLESKTKTVREIFEREITGEMIQKADTLIRESEARILETESLLEKVGI